MWPSDAAPSRSHPDVRPEAQAHWTWQSDPLVRWSQPSAVLVAREHDDRPRPLIGHQEPPARRVQTEIARPVAIRRDHLLERKRDDLGPGEQQEHRQELEKHFVLMQIDWIRDEKAEAIMNRYGVTREQAPNLIGVLVNKEGVFLQDTTGESPYKQMWCIDRDRIGALMKSASKPIDASQLKAWMDSM